MLKHHENMLLGTDAWTENVQKQISENETRSVKQDTSKHSWWKQLLTPVFPDLHTVALHASFLASNQSLMNKSTCKVLFKYLFPSLYILMIFLSSVMRHFLVDIFFVWPLPGLSGVIDAKTE